MKEGYCQYRHCDNELKFKRKGSKYCCRKHKDMERTYAKRKIKLLEKWAKIEMQTIEIIKLIKNS